MGCPEEWRVSSGEILQSGHTSRERGVGLHAQEIREASGHAQMHRIARPASPPECDHAVALLSGYGIQGCPLLCLDSWFI